MEGKKNTGLIVFLVLIIVVLAALCGLLASGKIDFNINGKSNATNDNTNIDTDETDTDNSKDEIIKKLKEALTDQAWIKENLYSKINCFDEEVDTEEKRDLQFEVLYDNDKMPIVIVNDYSVERFTSACYKVSVVNGVVTAERVGYIGHPGHGGFYIDKVQGLVINTYGHMGNFGFHVYDVKGKEITDYDEYTCNTGNCEYVYKGDKEYTISDISLDLTDDNVNNYIK